MNLIRLHKLLRSSKSLPSRRLRESLRTATMDWPHLHLLQHQLWVRTFPVEHPRPSRAHPLMRQSVVLLHHRTNNRQCLASELPSLLIRRARCRRQRRCMSTKRSTCSMAVQTRDHRHVAQQSRSLLEWLHPRRHVLRALGLQSRHSSLNSLNSPGNSLRLHRSVELSSKQHHRLQQHTAHSNSNRHSNHSNHSNRNSSNHLLNSGRLLNKGNLHSHAQRRSKPQHKPIAIEQHHQTHMLLLRQMPEPDHELNQQPHQHKPTGLL
jgi:hypothetical protein